MRRNVRYNSKHITEIKNVLLQHINSNLKDYLILSIIFIIGVMVGVMIINKSNEQSKLDISGYINGFIETIKNETYEVDKVKLVKVSILENLKMVAIVWLAGSTIVGIPLVYIIISYKGFCIGYTISAIISSLGVGKRYCIFYYGAIPTEYYSNSNNTNVECKCIEAV